MSDKLFIGQWIHAWGQDRHTDVPKGDETPVSLRQLPSQSSSTHPGSEKWTTLASHTWEVIKCSFRFLSTLTILERKNKELGGSAEKISHYKVASLVWLGAHPAVRTELGTGARCVQSLWLTRCLGDATRCWAKIICPSAWGCSGAAGCQFGSEAQYEI